MLGEFVPGGDQIPSHSAVGQDRDPSWYIQIQPPGWGFSGRKRILSLPPWGLSKSMWYNHVAMTLKIAPKRTLRKGRACPGPRQMMGRRCWFISLVTSLPGFYWAHPYIRNLTVNNIHIVSVLNASDYTASQALFPEILTWWWGAWLKNLHLEHM